MKLQILEADLAEFKEIILNKIQKAIRFRFNKSAYMNDLNNGTDDTPPFKAFEEGSETMSKEANSQLAIRRKVYRDLKTLFV
jgi:hypothetical protein